MIEFSICTSQPLKILIVCNACRSTIIFLSFDQFSNRQIWANMVDQDQTAPSVKTNIVSHSVSIFWTNLSILKPHCSNFIHFFGVSNFYGSIPAVNTLVAWHSHLTCTTHQASLYQQSSEPPLRCATHHTPPH